jgi:hypothetical protein
MIRHIETKHFDTTIEIESKDRKNKSEIDYKKIQNEIEHKGQIIDKYA